MKLCDIVTSFGQLNFVRLQPKNAGDAEKYLTLLLEFSRHPSLVMAVGNFSKAITTLLITLDTLTVWNVVFREDKDSKAHFINMEFFDKFYPALLEICSNKMLRELGNPENESNELI